MSSNLFNRGSIDPAAAFRQASVLHDQGRALEAAHLYGLVLKGDPNHFGSLSGLGVIYLQQGQFEAAERLFRRATKIDKKSAEAQHHLGFALIGLGQIKPAIRALEKAVKIQPAFPEALNNLGHALQRAGQYDDAARSFRKALELRPDYPEAHNNLGNVTHLLGRSGEALTHYESALALKPDYPEAHWNRANSLRDLGRFNDAVAAYQDAIRFRPEYPEALNGLGNTLQMLSQYEEAVEAYKKAVTLNPGYSDALVNWGNALVGLGMREEAVALFERAIEADRNNVGAYNRKGQALAKLKRVDEAALVFEQALAIEPDNIDAFNGVLTSSPRGCDWRRVAALMAEVPDRIKRGQAVDPFALLALCNDPDLQAKSAAHFARSRGSAFANSFAPASASSIQRIRVAYIATGFHQHPTAYLTAELLEIHDRSRFDIIGISLGPDDGSDIRARIIKAVDQFHDVRDMSDDEASALIKDLRIDIAIDRSGYTNNCRPGIFSRRSAPVQVNYIGFPGSLGAEFYDYVIADPIVLPMDRQKYYAEQIVHLPDSYLVNQSNRPIADQCPSRQEAGLPEDGFVFCCFNGNQKITPEIFDVWMRLLGQVDGSVLWLLRSNPSSERNLRNAAASRRVDPDRLRFAGFVPPEHHLARHRLADLFLDTLPYNAHTTASESLWAGLPVLTCIGDCFAGRVAASLLAAIGLSDLITSRLDDYEALALKLAREPDRLAEIRPRLERNRLAFPLFDGQRYRRHLEEAYAIMWDRWRRGEPARSFAVQKTI